MPNNQKDWARFEQKFEPNDQGCWIWTAARGTRDYGVFRVAGFQVRAHRFSYEQLVGPIPDGLQIDHLCCVHACVNPEHLEPVTNAENQLRHHAYIRSIGPNMCREGIHEVAGDNKHVDSAGRSRCRACNNAKNAARNRARRAKASAQ